SATDSAVRRLRVLIDVDFEHHRGSMPMNRIVVVMILVLAALIPTRAQTRPNFSGFWKQNMDKSAKGPFQSYSERIEQTDLALKVTTTSATAPRREKTSAQTYEFGKPITGADKEGDRLTTVVNWDGPTLVFVTTEQEGKRTIETRETWSLSD